MSEHYSWYPSWDAAVILFPCRSQCLNSLFPKLQICILHFMELLVVICVQVNMMTGISVESAAYRGWVSVTQETQHFIMRVTKKPYLIWTDHVCLIPDPFNKVSVGSQHSWSNQMDASLFMHLFVCWPVSQARLVIINIGREPTFSYFCTIAVG